MKQILEQLLEGARWVADTASRFSVRRDTAPIDTVARLFDFVGTRAALVTQKKLYGYLKERMGMNYPKMFDDDALSASIDIAGKQVFAAALSDLTVHAVAHASAGGALARDPRNRLAAACYVAGVASNFGEELDPRTRAAWLSDFERRLDGTIWDNVAAGANAFDESPKALFKWAPIADELKNLDREIVENSMRFAWNEIREDLRSRLDPAAIARDWDARERQRDD